MNEVLQAKLSSLVESIQDELALVLEDIYSDNITPKTAQTIALCERNIHTLKLSVWSLNKKGN